MSSPAVLPADLSAEEKRALLVRLIEEKSRRAAVAVHPLSYGQQALWFLYQVAPANAAYNIAFATRITSAVDVPALRRAFQTLLNRHPALRTTYGVREGEPVQQVHGYRELCFEQVDVAALDAGALDQLVRESYRRPFDLEQGPIFRVQLFSRSATDHVLLLALHHIAGDLWSLVILMDELRILYPAEQAGRAVSLPAPGAHYDDYVRWQAEQLGGPEGERLWDYWQRQLAGAQPVLNLPLDRPRPPVQSYRGASLPVPLDDALAARLRDLARAEGVTLYTLLLAAFQVLLHRYSHQDDILVGSPTLGRTRAEFSGTVGYFVNPVALRGDLAGNPPFRAFLRQMRETVLAALAHQDYPLALLVERLKLERDLSRSPLFQALFVYQKPQEAQEVAGLFVPGQAGARVTVGGIELEAFPLAQQEGQFDLQLEIGEMGDALFGVLKYNTDLFEPDTIARMAGHLQVLLAAIVANPEQQVAALPLLTAAERHQILVEWNATAVDYPLHRCLHQLIEEQVERTPDAPALVFEDAQLSYRELNRRANQLARYLQSLGVGPEVRVGVCMDRSLELVIGLLAVLKAGGAYVPLDPDYPAETLAFMLADSQVPVLLTTTDRRLRIADLIAGQTAVISLDTDWPTIAQQSAENLACPATAENIAYMIYTSGSTGRPKGALNTHRGIVNRLLWMQDAYRLDASDRVLQKTPFSFDVSVWEFFWPLLTGACLIVARPGGHRDGAYLVRTIAEQRITTLHFVPSMLQIFLEEPDLDRCTSLRRVICSGEALPIELQERFFARLRAELHNLYGPTEAAVDVTYWACRPGWPRASVPIGRPIANTQIYLLDAAMQPVPIGVPGELHIGGVNVGRGYWNRPELTAERFVDIGLPDSDQSPIPHPTSRIYKTGDLCRFLADGAIEYLGRIDHQVKIRGFRVELGEIEARLEQHPAVRSAVVLAREDRPGDKRLVAYVTVKEAGGGKREAAISSHLPSPASLPVELRAFLKDRLPEYMVPAAFVLLDAMPLTPNGKVNRRALPAPAETRSEASAPYAAPRTEVEQIIAAIWQEVLQAPAVGIHDNFFDLGGHSLLVARVQNRLRAALGRELAVVDLFKYPTVDALARFITHEEQGQPALAAVHARARQRQEANERRQTAQRSRRDGE